MDRYIEEFYMTLDIWLSNLELYGEPELRFQPDPENWSLGQLYMHLITETGWFLQQLEICSGISENATRQMSEKARAMFQANEFPNQKIKGQATVENVPQPSNKAVLHEKMSELKNHLGKIIMHKRTQRTGKTEHPGLGYFNGEEWLRYATMHLRHHMRQSKRIEGDIQQIRSALKTKNSH